MRVIAYDDMRYAGRDGEVVTVTVDPDNTVQMVAYTLDGHTQPLTAGETISFTLNRKPDNGPTVLQMNFDFTDDSGGSYRVGLKSVEGKPDQESVYNVNGPPYTIRNYRFFVE